MTCEAKAVWDRSLTQVCTFEACWEAHLLNGSGLFRVRFLCDRHLRLYLKLPKLVTSYRPLAPQSVGSVH